MRRRLGWVVLLGVVIGAFVVAEVDEGEPRTNAEVAADIAADFACPICDGESVAESDVPVARAIRQEIRAMVDDGRSRAEIRDTLVALYDEEIDLTPRSDGVVGLVWMLPVIVFVAGAAGLVAAFRRWKSDVRRSSATVADRELVARARADRPES